MKKLLFWVVVCCLVPCVALCSGLKVGEPLPAFTVEQSGKNGKLVMEGGKITYTEFESGGLTGKVRSILYMAARKKASDLNEAYSDKLSEVKFPVDKHQTVVIFNLNDTSMFEAGPFRQAAIKNQKKDPSTMYVVDGKASGKAALGLKEKSYAVILVDRAGKVLAYNDGKLSAEKIDEYINIIKSNM